jgi:hypothetical protein
LLIQRVLPLIFCVLPLLAAALVAVATPAQAREFYLSKMSSMDMLILGLGGAIFVLQIMLSWRALQWRGASFDQRPDKLLSNLAQTGKGDRLSKPSSWRVRTRRPRLWCSAP